MHFQEIQAKVESFIFILAQIKSNPFSKPSKFV